MPRKNSKKAQEIKDKIKKWDDYWRDNKNIYNEFNEFVWGNQWMEQEAKVFDKYQKTPLTSNKLAVKANHIIGEQRQKTPDLECVPSNDVDVQTADVRKALVDEITFNSQSKQVYQTAFQNSLVGGYGCFYVDTEYENDYGMEQVIRIKELKIPNRAFWDLSAEDQTKIDGMHCGFRERISRNKFRSLWGKKIEEDIPAEPVDDYNVYNDDDSICLVTCWERKYKPEKLRSLSDGRTVNEEEFDSLEREVIDDYEMLISNGSPVTIVKERMTPNYKVKKLLYAGEYELEKQDFPSKHLPMIFVDQNSYYDKKGCQFIRSFFKDSRDDQRYINYIRTQSAYLLKISRADQFLVSKENVRGEDTQAIWRNPLTVMGGLFFDPSPNGFFPQQLRPYELSPSLIQQYQMATNDIQVNTGVYDTFMGDQGNEVSKVAIDSRKKSGSYNTYLPFDNLNRAIGSCGILVNEMIPSVYDTHRTLMLDMKDSGKVPVEINKPLDEYHGSVIQNDMTQGKYTIKLLPGPGQEGQKEESLQSLNMVLQANPEMFKLIADLYVENLPMANTLEIKNRLKTIVPPEIIQAGKTGQPLPPPPPPPPDPMIELKMQELKLKEQNLIMEQQKLQMDAHSTQQEIEMKWAEIEEKRERNAAELQETELKYLAENARTASNEQIASTDHLIKLLTNKKEAIHE